MDSPAVAAAAICAIWVAGAPAARLLRMQGALFIAASWLFGSALLALLMLLASALQAPLTRPLLAFCWCIAVALPAALGDLTPLGSFRRGRSDLRPEVRPTGEMPRPAMAALARYICSEKRLRLLSDGRHHADCGRVNAVPVHTGVAKAGHYYSMHARRWPARLPALVDLPALGICLFQVAYVLVQSVRVPLGSFDAWALWEYKGRHFWLDRGVTGGFLHDHAAIFAHPAYPPLIALLIAWIYTWLGAADPALMKPLFAAFYAALLPAFYAALRPRIGRCGALLATAALALLPQVANYAGTGLADVPLAAALVASGAALVLWHHSGEERALLAGGALLGVALLIKHDALFFAMAAAPAVAAIARAWRAAVRYAALACAIGLPWYIYVRITGVPDRDFLPLTIQSAIAHAGRIGGIARLFALNLLAVNEWSVLWYLFAALLLFGLLRRQLRAPVLLLPVLLPLALYVCSLSLSAWPDYMLHVRTSLDRLILVTAPFALWFVVEQVRPAPGTIGGRGAQPVCGVSPKTLGSVPHSALPHSPNSVNHRSAAAPTALLSAVGSDSSSARKV